MEVKGLKQNYLLYKCFRILSFVIDKIYVIKSTASINDQPFMLHLQTPVRESIYESSFRQTHV